jgi:hypothetical protein
MSPSTTKMPSISWPKMVSQPLPLSMRTKLPYTRSLPISETFPAAAARRFSAIIYKRMLQSTAETAAGRLST